MPDIVEKTTGNTGVMVAFMLPEWVSHYLYSRVAPTIAALGVEPVRPEEYHITLVFAGDSIEIGDKRFVVVEALTEMISGIRGGEIGGLINGFGRFFSDSSETTDPIYLSFDGPEFPWFRAKVLDALNSVGVAMHQDHGFTPHITVGYVPKRSPTPDLFFETIWFGFDRVTLEWGSHRDEYVFPNLQPVEEMAMLVKSVDITENDDGDLIIPVVGIPFGGPVKSIVTKLGTDLHEDFFHPKTNPGPLTTVLSYFDHGRDSEWLPPEMKDKGFGKQLIGVATRGETTDEGILYRIIVDRRHKYKSLLRRLAEENILDASSKASQRINDKNVRGKIDEWHTVTMDLTPAPANPDAVNLYKSLILEWETEMVDTKQAASDAPAEKQEQETQDATSQNGSEKSATPVTDQVRALFAETEKSADAEEKVTEEETVMSLLKSINAQLTGYGKKFDRIEGNITDLQEAIPVLGEHIAKSLGKTMKRETGKSAAETQAEQLAKSQVIAGQNTTPAKSAGKLPKNAPGMN